MAAADLFHVMEVLFWILFGAAAAYILWGFVRVIVELLRERGPASFGGPRGASQGSAGGTGVGPVESYSEISGGEVGDVAGSDSDGGSDAGGGDFSGGGGESGGGGSSGGW